MKYTSLLVISTFFSLFACVAKVRAEDAKPPLTAAANPIATSAQVTLKGVAMNEADNCFVDHGKTLGADEKKLMVLYALEGTPEVASALAEIMEENWPHDSMDGQQARNLNEAWGKRLKYYITPNGVKGPNQNNVSITGVISEKDGKKWITPSKIAGTPLKYPDKMLAPDKPFKMPGKEPMMLKVTDTLSLKCVLLPRGSFLFEKPYYFHVRWVDEFPRMITLTKPFWMAEIPVTQEMWDAVMGADTDRSTLKDPQRPVRNIPCAEINKFCRILSEKNGRTVRLPGECEWEYAARVGTSNPPFDEKFKGQNSWSNKEGMKGCLPVKSRQPNAWGIYDMISGAAFEMTRDRFILGRRMDEVDPYWSCEKDEADGTAHKHWGRNAANYHESINYHCEKQSDTEYGSSKLRIVVEATPAEIVAMEKAEKK